MQFTRCCTFSSRSWDSVKPPPQVPLEPLTPMFYVLEITDALGTHRIISEEPLKRHRSNGSVTLRLVGTFQSVEGAMKGFMRATVDRNQTIWLVESAQPGDLCP
jgi:hypothetical protein